MNKDELLELLSDDNEYYNGEGRQYLSNSDIGTLLNNPKMFGIPRKDNKVMSEGRLFHTMLLEPHKEVDIHIVDASSRNTKVYKDYIADNNLEFCLLQKEYDKVNDWVMAIKSNLEFYDMIYDEGNKYEVPEVTEIKGMVWKGKADIVGTDCLIDLKTTGDINKFKYSARAYNYDSQCYIYQKLFNKPLKFLAIDKETKQLGLFTPTDEFLERGERKVEKAVDIYNRFFSVNSEEDVHNYYIEQTLD